MTNQNLRFYNLKSKSPLYLKMLHLCQKASNSNANVLLIGESGSGKEVAAHYLHYNSKRKEKPFVSINCTSYTESLLESELFGYEAGAFTGATKTKSGKIETANTGSLFLDEIGDLRLLTQVKLLRTIEQKKIQRLGSNIELDVDFRLISATNINVCDAVNQNKFREDFFYRISTIVIKVPALRERREDLRDLIDYMLVKSQHEHQIEISHIEPHVMEFLMNYNYPGNIRELKNIIDRMVVLSDDGIISDDGLPIMHSIKSSTNQCNTYNFKNFIDYKDFKNQSEKAYLEWVLGQFNGNVNKTAEAIHMSSRQLFNKINQYGLK